MSNFFACDHCENNATDEIERLNAENAKLREVMEAVAIGAYKELCSDRDAPQCEECVMFRSREGCAMTDMQDMLGIDCFGNEVEN